MDWHSIDGLSSVIRNANWGIAASVLSTFFFTVIVIVADKKREALTGQVELAKKEEIAAITKLAGDANERAGKLEKSEIGSGNSAAQIERKAGNSIVVIDAICWPHCWDQVKGHDVSGFFTNSGAMRKPIQRVNVDFTSAMLEEIESAAKDLNVSRQAVIKTLVRQGLDQRQRARASRTRAKRS